MSEDICLPDLHLDATLSRKIIFSSKPKLDATNANQGVFFCYDGMSTAETNYTYMKPTLMDTGLNGFKQKYFNHLANLFVLASF